MGKSEFYITDGKKFVKRNINNQFQLVNNYAIADLWDTYQVAKAVLDNSIPKSWRKSFYIARLEDGEMQKRSSTQEERALTKEEILQNNVPPKMFDLDLYDNKHDFELNTLVSAFEIVSANIENIEQKLTELRKRLQFLDYAFEDVKHYHLQENLGTVKAYKRDSLESEILGERMFVKNKIEIYQKINRHKTELCEAIKDVCDTVNNIRSKKYVPRVLPELFEDGVDIVTPELLDKVAQNGRISRRAVR